MKANKVEIADKHGNKNYKNRVYMVSTKESSRIQRNKRFTNMIVGGRLRG